MAERSLTPEQRRCQQALATMVELSDGWHEVLGIIFARLQSYEAQMNGRWDATYRLDAIARKQAMLDLVQTVYDLAQVPSPFAQHYAALTASFRPPPAPPPPSPEQTADQVAM